MEGICKNHEDEGVWQAYGGKTKQFLVPLLALRALHAICLQLSFSHQPAVGKSVTSAITSCVSAPVIKVFPIQRLATGKQ